MMSKFKKAIPWWIRIAIKMFLSRLPFDYSFWKRIGVFKLGNMDDPLAAYLKFIESADEAGVLDKSSKSPRLKVKNDFTVLELGPGDSLFTIIISKVLGASGSYLIDAGSFASKSLDIYKNLLQFLEEKGLTLPFEKQQKSIGDIVAKCNGKYLTQGITSFKSIPTQSIDFCFSSTVLQHIPKKDFTLMSEEMYRVMKKNSVGVHSVDFTDCISGKVDFNDPASGNLNNMRFSDSIWESSFFISSGFYTNRLRLNEMLKVFNQAGFKTKVLKTLYWNRLPISRDKLDSLFQHLSNDDLLVKNAHIFLQKI